MAYMNQDKKKELAPGIKEVLKKYGMKATIAVRNHSTLVVNIKEGELDLLAEYRDRIREQQKNPNCFYHRTEEEIEAITYFEVNEHHIEDGYSGKVRDFFNELRDAMMIGNHNNSDLQTDYFDVGWYININAGQWNKPFIHTPKVV